MGKRLRPPRKASEGTISIKSFFTSLGKKNDGNTSKSSNDSSVSNEEGSDEQEQSSDSDWAENSRTRRKRPRKAKAVASKKVKKMLVETTGRSKKSRRNKSKEEEDDDDIKVVKTVKSVDKPKIVEKEVDAEVAAFLKSGIPAATSKAQKLVSARIEEEEFSKTVQYFPVYTHVSEALPLSSPDHSSWEQNLGLKYDSDSFCASFEPPNISSSALGDKINEFVFTGVKKDLGSRKTKQDTVLCCKIPNKMLVEESDGIMNDMEKHRIDLLEDTLNLPWIEKYEITNKSDLAVNEDTLDKIETWLRHWKLDIKDDGGKSRKFVEKKHPRKNPDLDFVTSEEDTEFKTKSLLLYGATGCGKTGAISILAKKMGFKVVEVNFSTSRSGKDVLRRVEEATLSHRLESSHACLLLFKDICLIEPKEDEGFVSAVAQLITSSCRPIVMTMSYPPSPQPFYVGGDCDTILLDSKIENKNPMSVWFPPQSPSTIVKKVLLPIIKSEFPHYELPRHITYTLYSIARHCKGDIRQSINQAQLFLQTFHSKPCLDFHSHISPFIDLNFLRKASAKVSRSSSGPGNSYTSYHARSILSSQEVVVSKSGSAAGTKNKPSCSRKELREEIATLNTIVEHLEFAVDLDRGNSFMHRRSHNDNHYDDDLKMGRCQAIRSYFDSNLKDLYRLSKIPKLARCSPDLGSCSQDSVAGEGEGNSDRSESPGSSGEKSPNRSSFLIPSDFHLHSLLFDSDKDAEREDQEQKLRFDMEDYCGTSLDVATCGQVNFHDYAYVRTIIKTNKINGSGPCQKRNRRVSYYFNRVGNELIDAICNTFDFQLELKIAKQCR